MIEIRKRKLKLLKIACSVIASILIEGKEHHYFIKEGLPEDTKIVNVRMGSGDFFELLLESEKFEPINIFEEVPEMKSIIVETYPYGFKIVADRKEEEVDINHE